jgi:hypothetical protein
VVSWYEVTETAHRGHHVKGKGNARSPQKMAALLHDVGVKLIAHISQVLLHCRVMRVADIVRLILAVDTAWVLDFLYGDFLCWLAVDTAPDLDFLYWLAVDTAWILDFLYEDFLCWLAVETAPDLDLLYWLAVDTAWVLDFVVWLAVDTAWHPQ